MKMSGLSGCDLGETAHREQKRQQEKGDEGARRRNRRLRREQVGSLHDPAQQESDGHDHNPHEPQLTGRQLAHFGKPVAHRLGKCGIGQTFKNQYHADEEE